MEKTYQILKIVLLALVLVALILGAKVLYRNLQDQVQMDALAPAGTQPQKEEKEEKVFPAPVFTVYDIDGNAHALSDFQGKPVVLSFWASWCGVCESDMPYFEEKYLAYGDQVHFLMVNLTDSIQETVVSATEFIQERGYTFPVYYDVNLDAVAKYAVNSVPVTYFIDAQGNFVTYGRGALSAEALQQGIDMLLEK